LFTAWEALYTLRLTVIKEESHLSAHGDATFQGSTVSQRAQMQLGYIETYDAIEL
jgi:hypothetical protein